MNFKKLISRFMLIGLLLAPMPPMCGMEQNNNLNQDGSRAEQSLRNRKRIECNWSSTRNKLLVASLFSSYCVINNILNIKDYYFNLCEYTVPRNVIPLVGVMGLICSLHLPIISIVSTIRNNPADPLNQTPVLRNAVESIKQKGERLSFLRNRSHNVDRVDAQDMTALMRAARNNNNELVRLSVMNGANLDLASADRKNALMHAIDADDLEITRILLLLGAEKNEALIYLRTEISRYESEIAALDAEIAQVNANGDAPRILAEKREDLAILQKMQQLFSQTPVQLLAPLTPAQKLEYKKMFTGREQVKPSLQGSLMLYEHFDDAMALKKYLKVRTPIATGLSSRIPTSIYTHVMSFLRKKSDEKEQRLEQALRKAIICKDEELSQLLVKNGVELDIDEKIAAQFN